MAVDKEAISLSRVYSYDSKYMLILILQRDLKKDSVKKYVVPTIQSSLFIVQTRPHLQLDC